LASSNSLAARSGCGIWDTGQSYTYIRDNDRDDFADVTEYVYDRFKRCVYHRVTHVLDAHSAEFHAFQFVTDTVGGSARVRTQLSDFGRVRVGTRVGVVPTDRPTSCPGTGERS
jgi:hypothetical protein